MTQQIHPKTRAIQHRLILYLLFCETEKITKKTSETTEIIVFFSKTPEITK